MTSEQLAHLQTVAALILLLCVGIGAIYLLAGLVRPGWVWRKGRGSVVLVSIGLWLLGLATYAGIIGYTHSHPNGPHAVKGYIEDYFAEQCAQGADLPACKKDGASATGATAGGATP